MIVSMTGYGHASAETQRLRGTVTARGVNHRFFDVSLRMPRWATPLEPTIKALAQDRARRGRIEISIEAELVAAGEPTLSVSRPLVGELAREALLLKDEYGLACELGVADVYRVPGVVEVSRAEALDESARTETLDLVGRALADMALARESEGRCLGVEIERRFAAIEAALGGVCGGDVLGREQKITALRERVVDLSLEPGLDAGRLHAEAVRLVERHDITEEVARVRGHVAAAREACAATAPCGKHLDFLAQELMREANTIASKAVSLAVVHGAVALKNEIEKLREQVQNVE